MVTSVAISHSSFVFWFLTDSFSDICKPAERRNMCGIVWKAQQRKCISPGSLFTADTSLQSFTYKMCLSTLDCVQRAQKISAIQSCKTLCTPQFLLSFPFLSLISPLPFSSYTFTSSPLVVSTQFSWTFTSCLLFCIPHGFPSPPMILVPCSAFSSSFISFTVSGSPPFLSFLLSFP